MRAQHLFSWLSPCLWGVMHNLFCFRAESDFREMIMEGLYFVLWFSMWVQWHSSLQHQHALHPEQGGQFTEREKKAWLMRSFPLKCFWGIISKSTFCCFLLQKFFFSFLFLSFANLNIHSRTNDALIKDPPSQESWKKFPIFLTTPFRHRNEAAGGSKKIPNGYILKTLHQLLSGCHSNSDVDGAAFASDLWSLDASWPMISDLKSPCFQLFFYAININENVVSDINDWLIYFFFWQTSIFMIFFNIPQLPLKSRKIYASMINCPLYDRLYPN